MKKCRNFRKIFIAPIIILVFIGIGYITMALWNALMPMIFHLPLITFWQAIGLIVLSRIIVGHGLHRGWGHHNRANYFRQRWERFSPEEKEKLYRWDTLSPDEKHQFYSRFGYCRSRGKDKSTDINEQGKTENSNS